MADKTPEQAAAALDRVARELERPGDLAHKLAEAILRQAVRNAASKPTPQAAMAADAMSVQGDTIRTTAGGAPAAVAMGSEFGSDIYPQFHRPRNGSGYWLFPAGDSIQVKTEGDTALEDVVQRAVR